MSGRVINGGFGVRFPLAATKLICPVCQEENGGEILLGQRSTTTPEGEHQIDKMHNQVSGFSDCICDKCRGQLGKPGAYIVVIDEDKSYREIDGKFGIPEKVLDKENPWRTGHVFGLVDDFFARLLEDQPNVLEQVRKKGMLYMDIKVAKQINLPIQ